MTLDQRTITFSIIQWTRRFLKHNNKHTIEICFIYVVHQQQQQQQKEEEKKTTLIKENKKGVQN